MHRMFAVRVGKVEHLTPHFVRVSLTSEDLARLGQGGPDQRIKVLFPLPDRGFAGLPQGEDWYQRWRVLPGQERHPMRTYTIRRGDPHARQLVVDFVAHGDAGPASRWVSRAAVGDELVVVAPDSSSTVEGGFEWRPGTARTVLLAGDETAAPAIGAILESLPDDVHGAAFVEVPTAADTLPLTGPPGVAVTWLARDGASHGDRLGPIVRAWTQRWLTEHGAGGGPAGPPDDDPGGDRENVWEVPEGPTDGGLYAWLAGESGAITGLRRRLVGELGLDRSRIAFMGYWRLGRAEN